MLVLMKGNSSSTQMVEEVVGRINRREKELGRRGFSHSIIKHQESSYKFGKKICREIKGGVRAVV